MTARSEISQPTDVIIDYSALREKVFWAKLVLGAVFGALSYFIFRFFIYVTFFVVIPALYFSTYLLILLAVLVKTGMKIPMDKKPLLRLPLNYSSTWLMAFFVFAVACYYFGW
ncbi:hypothetical protein EU545_05610 [Candidatus Thorarchaeota archaeon]|nr:MAG: hypothetical protein EU545_05610 [Candidatus Thorarchaeota archaeon]